ncbi:MAG: hypothetical protein ACRCTA_04825, partial [Bacilli bacterium]
MIKLNSIDLVPKGLDMTKYQFINETIGDSTYLLVIQFKNTAVVNSLWILIMASLVMQYLILSKYYKQMTYANMFIRLITMIVFSFILFFMFNYNNSVSFGEYTSYLLALHFDIVFMGFA